MTAPLGTSASSFVRGTCASPSAVAETPGALLVQGRASSTPAPAGPNNRDHGPIDSRRSGAVAQPVRAGDS